MSRTRWWTAVGIVGVLALAAGWMIWREQSTPGPTTTLVAAPITTLADPTTTALVTPTLQASTTSTTTAEQREAEVEQILTDLWYGWFDAIYRKDADSLWDVVATTPFHDAGVEAMNFLDFDAAPARDLIEVEVDEILLDRHDCLVVFGTASAPFLAGDPTNSTVKVMWPDDEQSWRFATSWRYRDDLWQADCDEIQREVTP